ncbi:MAG: hypothetical protein ABIG63_00160 [Chloroflexota bacterium]
MKYKVWKKRVQNFSGEDIVLPEGVVIIKCKEHLTYTRIVFLEPVPEPSPEPTG